MKLTIKEPATDTELELNAEPEDYNGEQGWRIVSPDKDSFVVVQKEGEWHVMDESDVNPELIKAIGEALRPVATYSGRSSVD